MRTVLKNHAALLAVIAFLSAPSWAQVVSQSYGALAYLNTATVARGGTGQTSAGIAAFNAITGYTAAGATGTTSANVVFSASPTLTGEVLIQAADGARILGLSGTTKGFRVITNSTATLFDFVDTSLGGSYQPGIINGSTLTFQTGVVNALSIDASQNITGAATIRANTGFNFNGTAGISVVCTVTPTGITISGGIITAVTGGTCV